METSNSRPTVNTVQDFVEPFPCGSTCPICNQGYESDSDDWEDETEKDKSMEEQHMVPPSTEKKSFELDSEEWPELRSRNELAILGDDWEVVSEISSVESWDTAVDSQPSYKKVLLQQAMTTRTPIEKRKASHQVKYYSKSLKTIKKKNLPDKDDMEISGDDILFFFRDGVKQARGGRQRGMFKGNAKRGDSSRHWLRLTWKDESKRHTTDGYN